jgi:transposase
MSPYSFDLRQRVLHAVDEGKLTKWAISLLFQVSPAWIRRLLQRRRESGTIAPKPHQGGPAPKLNEEHRRRLAEWVREQSDATLAELAERLQRESNVEVSTATVCRVLKAMNLPLKKSRSAPANKRGRTSRSSGPNTARRSPFSNPAE